MHDFKVITVTKSPENTMIIHNPTNYILIGQGDQGAVFKISDTCCVKIYVSNEYTAREYSSYQAAKNSSLVPKIYEKGVNYIILEYLRGPSLECYLQGIGMMPKWVTKQILCVLKEMKRLRFTKVDSFLRHIFIDKNHKVKIIDLVNAYTVSDSLPSRLFGDLKRLGLLKVFLQQAKELAPDLHNEWQRSPQFYSQ